MSTESRPLEQRVLLRAATSRDAVMTMAVLRRAQFAPHACVDLAELVSEMLKGAGAVVVAEEMLVGPPGMAFKRALDNQPPWSDLPVLVLARQGADSQAIADAMDQAANVTVIERPVRVASFVSSVRSALRARNRQYDLRDMVDSLKEADQRKTEFLATLAHELRNPLAPLVSSLTLLNRMKPAPQEAQRFYDMMRRQVDHMIRLVNDLMEVSRITRGKIELDLADVDLNQVAQEALALSRPLVDKSGHALTVNLAGEPLVVQGDGVRLTQVLSNLVNNAAKYTPGAGHVTLLTRRDGPDAVVEVSDTGVGIAPEMIGSIFDMFVQASGASKSAQGGLGIGLTLARSLVELHGGSVAARSDGMGRGATFTVRLPSKPSAAVVPKPAQQTTDSVVATPFAALVVDDNRDAADGLSEMLESMGISVTVAYSGDAALAALDVARPSLAILDLGMPGMDGCELAQRIRRMPAHADTVLVALTGWAQQRDKERTAAAGFDYHLAKPLDLDGLTPILRDMKVLSD